MQQWVAPPCCRQPTLTLFHHRSPRVARYLSTNPWLQLAYEVYISHAENA